MREAAGLSQSELARRTGIAQPNLSSYEAGRRHVTPDVLDRVRRATRPRPSAALAEHKLQVLDIVHAHRGSRVRLIGSAARAEDTSDSDLDLLITLGPEADLLDQIAIAQELEDLLGVEVDIVDEASVRGPVGDRTLHRIVEFCGALDEVVARGNDAFVWDRMLKWAAEMDLIRIGEAVNRLPPELLREYGGQPWRQIIGLRNVAAHQYDDINYERLWNTLVRRVPELRRYITANLLGEE
jgi:uncharacterized protein with HEPN domain/predicted nucleotidyltransferase